MTMTNRLLVLSHNSHLAQNFIRHENVSMHVLLCWFASPLALWFAAMKIWFIMMYYAGSGGIDFGFISFPKIVI